MTSPRISLRSATIQDLDILNDLMFELHDHHHRAVPADFKSADEVQQEKSIARYLDSPDCLVLVATATKFADASSITKSDDPKIVGFVTAQFCELTSPISKPCFVGNIDELFVTPSWRQHGIAEALLVEAQTRLEHLGATQLMVEVWDFNQSALNLYKKQGFFPHIHCLRKKI